MGDQDEKKRLNFSFLHETVGDNALGIEMLRLISDMGEKISNLVSKVDILEGKVDGQATRLEDHMEKEEGDRTMILNRLEMTYKLIEAFPTNKDGKPDIEGHREYHDTKIDSGARWKKFWSDRLGRIADIVIGAILVAVILGAKYWILGR